MQLSNDGASEQLDKTNPYFPGSTSRTLCARHCNLRALFDNPVLAVRNRQTGSLGTTEPGEVGYYGRVYRISLQHKRTNRHSQQPACLRYLPTASDTAHRCLGLFTQRLPEMFVRGRCFRRRRQKEHARPCLEERTSLRRKRFGRLVPSILHHNRTCCTSIWLAYSLRCTTQRGYSKFRYRARPR